MEQNTFEELVTEFEGDGEIQDMIQKLKNAQKELEIAQSDHKKEKLRREEAEKLLKGKCRKLLVCTLEKKLSELIKDIETVKKVCNEERKETGKLQVEIMKIDKSKLLNVHQGCTLKIFCRNYSI